MVTAATSIRPQIFHDLRCPACGCALAWQSPVRCTHCDARYEESAGILTLVPTVLNLPEHPEEVYWRDLAPTQEGDWRVIKAHLVRGLVELFITRHQPAGRVLEVGAGCCWASSTLKAAIPDIEVTATDLSPSALHRGTRICGEIGGTVDRFIACDMGRLPFAEQSFDWVIGIAALHHASDVVAALREIRRVLKPGGAYFGFDEFAANAIFRRWWMEARWSPFARRHGELGVQEAVYTPQEWLDSFKAAGFLDANVRYNRDWRLKRRAGLRSAYFRLTAFLPNRMFSLLPGGSVLLDASA